MTSYSRPLSASASMSTDRSSVATPTPARINVKLVKAFVQPDGSHGNGAGVVLLSEANQAKSARPVAGISNGRFPSESDCLRIAKLVGLPETSFVLFPEEIKSNDIADGSQEKVDFHVKWFTPECEVNMCGHATVALAGYIHSTLKGIPQQNSHFWRMQCKSGLLGIEVVDDVRKDSLPRVVMEQAIPEFCGVVECDEIAASLNKKVDIDFAITITDGINDEHRKGDNGIGQYFPFPHCEIVSTGGRDLMIPVRSTVLNKMDILGNRIKNDDCNDSERQQLCQSINVVSEKYDIVGYHMFEVDDRLFGSKVNSSDNETIQGKNAKEDFSIHLDELIRLSQEASKNGLSIVESCLEAVGIKQLDSNDRSKTITTVDTTIQKSKTILVTGVRNFAPFVGIPEEPATGSANGALGCYLVKHLFLDAQCGGNGNGSSGSRYSLDFPVCFRFRMEQGRAMGEPCVIDAEIEVVKNEIRSVKVGGLVNVTGDSLDLDLTST